MSIISNIYNNLAANIKILTLASDSYFDGYWDAIKYPVFMAEDRKLDYVPNVALVRIGDIEQDYSHIIVHESRYADALKLSRMYHLPLIVISGENVYYNCHGQINLNCQEIESLDNYCNVPTVIITQNGHEKTFLARHEHCSLLAPFVKVEPLDYNYLKRAAQYAYSCGIISLYGDIWLPELREAEILNLPIFSIKNKYHKNLTEFSKISEISSLATVYNNNRSLSFEWKKSLPDTISELVHSINKYTYV